MRFPILGAVGLVALALLSSIPACNGSGGKGGGAVSTRFLLMPDGGAAPCTGITPRR